MIAAMVASVLCCALSAKPLPTLSELGDSERGNEIGCGIVPPVMSREELSELEKSAAVEERRLVWSALRANQLTRRAEEKDPTLVSSCDDLFALYQKASLRADNEAARKYRSTGRVRSGFNESILRSLR